MSWRPATPSPVAAPHALFRRTSPRQTSCAFDLVGFEESEDLFALLDAPFREPDGEGIEATVQVLTSGSSASCGLTLEAGAAYIVFAWRDGDGLYHTDTCRGTRIVDGGLAASGDLFVDVPSRTLSNTADDVEGGVRLHAAPEPRSEEVGRVDSYAQIATREIAYERPAAQVFERKNGWYRLRTTSGATVWTRAADAGRFVPYADLVTRRLNYLTRSWSGLFWPDPGAGIPFRFAAPRETDPVTGASVEVIEMQRIGGMLWLHIRVLATSPCEGVQENSSRGAGWIPAYGRTGQPNVWFYSRGC